MEEVNETLKEIETFIKKEEFLERERLAKKIHDIVWRINKETEFYCFYRLSPHVEIVYFHVTPKDDYETVIYSDEFKYDYEDKYDYLYTHEELMRSGRKRLNDLMKFLEPNAPDVVYDLFKNYNKHLS